MAISTGKDMSTANCCYLCNRHCWHHINHQCIYCCYHSYCKQLLEMAVVGVVVMAMMMILMKVMPVIMVVMVVVIVVMVKVVVAMMIVMLTVVVIVVMVISPFLSLSLPFSFSLSLSLSFSSNPFLPPSLTPLPPSNLSFYYLPFLLKIYFSYSLFSRLLYWFYFVINVYCVRGMLLFWKVYKLLFS